MLCSVFPHGELYTYIQTNIMFFVGHPQSKKSANLLLVTMVYKKPKVLYLCTGLRRLFLMIPWCQTKTSVSITWSITVNGWAGNIHRNSRGIIKPILSRTKWIHYFLRFIFHIVHVQIWKYATKVLHITSQAWFELSSAESESSVFLISVCNQSRCFIKLSCKQL